MSYVCLWVPVCISIHKIDFRNHGFYSSFHPLAFLKLPKFIWNLASAPDPTLNRARASAYEALASRYGYGCSMTVTHYSLVEAELPLGQATWPISIDTSPELYERQKIQGSLAQPYRSLRGATAPP